MGETLVLAFLALFAMAVVQGIVRRRLNPYAEVAFAGLPEELRAEVERVLPGYQSREARITKNGDEARLRGDYAGAPVRIEADFDPAGRLVDFEVDGPRAQTNQPASIDGVPAAAQAEIDRVLGAASACFEPTRVSRGTADGEEAFEVKGRADGWKWEVAVTAAGRLLEVEKERRRSR